MTVPMVSKHPFARCAWMFCALLGTMSAERMIRIADWLWDVSDWCDRRADALIGKEN